MGDLGDERPDQPSILYRQGSRKMILCNTTLTCPVPRIESTEIQRIGINRLLFIDTISSSCNRSSQSGVFRLMSAAGVVTASGSHSNFPVVVQTYIVLHSCDLLSYCLSYVGFIYPLQLE